MHERHLVADLVTEALRVCAGNGAGRVTRLRLRIGALSHVTPQGLRDALETAMAGTPLAGARIVIEQGRDPRAGDAEGVVLVDMEVAPAPATPD